MTERLSRIRAAVAKHAGVREVHVYGGLALVWVGANGLHPPLAYIAIGATLFWLGLGPSR